MSWGQQRDWLARSSSYVPWGIVAVVAWTASRGAVDIFPARMPSLKRVREKSAGE